MGGDLCGHYGQEWRLIGVADGSLLIQNLASGTCDGAGRQLLLTECDRERDDQRWEPAG